MSALLQDLPFCNEMHSIAVRIIVAIRCTDLPDCTEVCLKLVSNYATMVLCTTTTQGAVCCIVEGRANLVMNC